jgi:hypothetical protein
VLLCYVIKYVIISCIEKCVIDYIIWHILVPKREEYLTLFDDITASFFVEAVWVENIDIKISMVEEPID